MTPNAFPCSQIDEVIHDYTSGTLEPQERACFEDHLERCQSCARAFRDAQLILTGLAALREAPAPEALETIVEHFRRHEDGAMEEASLPLCDTREPSAGEGPDVRPPRLVATARGRVVDLQAKRQAMADVALNETVPRPLGAPSRAPTVTWHRVLVAGWAAGTLALAVWVAVLQGRVTELSSALQSETQLPPAAQGPPGVVSPPPELLARVEEELSAARLEWARSRARLEELERERTRLIEPQPFLPTLLLHPASSPHRAERTTEVVVPMEADSFQLEFLNPSATPYRRYELRLERADGAPVWRGSVQTPGAPGNFSALFRRTFLPAGTYRATLSSLDQGHPVKLAAYEWNLVFGTPSKGTIDEVRRGPSSEALKP